MKEALKAIIMCGFVAVLGTVSAQTISIVSYPPSGVYAPIVGTVQGVDPSRYVVAIVDDVFDTYWSKPTNDQPYVPIGADGTFYAQFISGGQDVCSQKVFLFLVPVGVSIPVTNNGSGIPLGLIQLAVASNVVDRTSTSLTSWSGYTWNKKDTGTCVWGPGPNYFSGDNVSVDASDRLHLSVLYTNGHWYCPEIISTNPFGYGQYTFDIYSMPTNLDGSLVVGLFIYDDDVAEYHREIDVEYSNGAVVGSDAPWQYVIQPYTAYLQRQRFSAPTNSFTWSHSFLWAPGVAHFDSFFASPTRSSLIRATYTPQYRPAFINAGWSPIWQMPPFDMLLPGTTVRHQDFGLFYNDTFFYRAWMTDISIDAPSQPFEAWSTIYGIPSPGNTKVHLNMWLYNSQPANTNAVYEVVLSKFEFRPVDVDSLVPKLEILNYISNTQNPEHSSLDLQFTVPAR